MIGRRLAEVRAAPIDAAHARFRRQLAVAVVIVGLFSACVAFSIGGTRFTTWVDDGGTALAAVAASVLCFVASRRSNGRRRFWLFLGAAMACWAFGEVIWGFYELVLNVDTPFPSVADIGYLSALPLAIIAMAVYPATGGRHRASRFRALLDGLIVSASILFVSWAEVLGPLTRQHGDSHFGTAVALAYPVGDIVIGSVALIAIHRGRFMGRSPLLFVAAGMLANAISDSAYAYLTQAGHYYSGNLIDTGWFAGYLLVCLAALMPAKHTEPVDGRSLSFVDIGVPYVALGIAVAVGAGKIATHQFTDQTLLWLALTCVVLVVFRQIIAMLDNGALSRDLEKKVERRTAQLAARTDELTAALAVANEASRLKTAFLANMSHEIRTPMNGVMGMLGLLLDGSLGATERDYAETMASSAEALMGVINDILDFSKLDAGKVEPEHAEFVLRSAVEAAIAGIAARAQEKNIELVNFIDTNIPTTVVGDRLRLRQVLANLLDNAVKFTETGDVVVRVLEGEGRCVRFEVSDTGIGIAPEGRDRLFDVFTQADVSTTRRFGGTGLGLAICKQLVELMGGRIGVESELGAGSTFWFILPLEVPLGAAEVLPRRDVLATMRVLVASSHPQLRAALLAQLQRWTPNLVSANDATAALASLRDAARTGSPFDVVVVDDNLGATSQLGLAHEIAADRLLVHTRIVALATPASVMTTAPEIHAWVTKPVRNAALLDRLVTVMGAPRDRPALSGVTGHPADPATTRSDADVAPLVRGTILVAEDNAINAKVAVATLAAMGYYADVARDGIEVLEALETRPYDTVLMDVQMPRLNGYDTTREIRRRGDHTTPIIAMTASAMESDRQECLAAGMDDYLSKPIDREALAEVLRTRVREHQPAG